MNGRRIGTLIWESERGWNCAERFAPTDSRLCQDMAIVRGAGFRTRDAAVAALARFTTDTQRVSP